MSSRCLPQQGNFEVVLVKDMNNEGEKLWFRSCDILHIKSISLKMASKYSNLIQQILLTATLGLFGFSPISFVNILTLSITIVQETSLQSHPLDLRTLLAVNELIFSCASFSRDKD